MVSLFKHQCHRHFFSKATSYCCVCHQQLCERCSHFSEKYQTHFCMNHFNHLKTHYWISVFCFKSSPENAEFGVSLFEKQKTLFAKKKIVTFFSIEYVVEKSCIQTVSTFYCLAQSQQEAISFFFST